MLVRHALVLAPIAALTAPASLAHAQWTVIDLQPANAASSIAQSASGSRQAGLAVVGPWAHASLWSGSAASWIDLNPAAAAESIAYAVNGSTQVGVATIDGVEHASLWSGSASSRVDLRPACPLPTLRGLPRHPPAPTFSAQSSPRPVPASRPDPSGYSGWRA